MTRSAGLLFAGVIGLILFSGCGGTSTAQPTVSARQVVSALRRHGIRAQIEYGAHAAPKSGPIALLDQFAGRPRPHVVATVAALPPHGIQTPQCRGCVGVMLSDTVAHRRSLWSGWRNDEPEYVTRGGRKVLVARVFLVANVYLEAHRPLISRAAATVRDLRRVARARSGGS